MRKRSPRWAEPLLVHGGSAQPAFLTAAAVWREYTGRISKYRRVSRRAQQEPSEARRPHPQAGGGSDALLGAHCRGHTGGVAGDGGLHQEAVGEGTIRADGLAGHEQVFKSLHDEGAVRDIAGAAVLGSDGPAEARAPCRRRRAFAPVVKLLLPMTSANFLHASATSSEVMR